MNKQGFVVTVLAIVIVITLIAAVVHEKNVRKLPPEPPTPVEQTVNEETFGPQHVTPDMETMEKTGIYDPNDPGLTPPPLNRGYSNQNQPNAIEVMAPGYNKANERLEQTKKLRIKSLEAQRNEINNLNLDR